MKKLLYVLFGILIICMSLLTGAIIAQHAHVNGLSGPAFVLVIVVLIIGVSLLFVNNIDESSNNK
ncbi:hypothetical protein [Aquibacillus sediminis]|uniref:hypothetical protein n=1 Tax=Aquibacillus sediminis TaxID=2574734 RepID=UPI00110991F0|nr:hypothetical protein [Aquibacillus sediminis]